MVVILTPIVLMVVGIPGYIYGEKTAKKKWAHKKNCVGCMDDFVGFTGVKYLSGPDSAG